MTNDVHPNIALILRLISAQEKQINLGKQGTTAGPIQETCRIAHTADKQNLHNCLQDRLVQQAIQTHRHTDTSAQPASIRFVSRK